MMRLQHMPWHAGELERSLQETGQISAETYAFIEEKVLPGLGWPSFSELLRDSSTRRTKPPFIYIDVFPALACQAAGGDSQRAIPLAAAWLLYIIAGRIFDDQQDGEGRKQPWPAAGTAKAISLGLFSLGAANAALSHLQVEPQTMSDILCAFGNVLSLSAYAQTTELNLSKLTVENYFAHIASKTGIVFATGAWSGARAANPRAADSIIDALYNFGMNLGMAIQIADDCEDLGTSDLHRQHFTLPVAYAISQKHHPRHSSLISMLESDSHENWVEGVVSLLAEMDAINWSLRVATIYRARALAALEPLPQDNLAALIAYATGTRNAAD